VNGRRSNFFSWERRIKRRSRSLIMMKTKEKKKKERSGS
jgi:uncharacterized protein involved in tolerance to divalent cations